MKLNPDKSIVDAVGKSLKKSGGQCPCVNEFKWNEDTKCPCKKQREEGICTCNLYVNEGEESNET